MSDKGLIFKDDGYNELEAAFSEEEVPIPGDELTGEVDTEDSTEGEVDDSTGDTTESTDADDTTADADTTGTEETEEDTAKDEDAEADAAKGDEDATEGDDSTTEDNEVDLRAELREQQKKVALTEAKLDTFTRQQKADKDAEETEEDAAVVEPSVLETHQAKLNHLAETRGEFISDMLEFMKMNPKYEDVESVCSKNNLDDVIDVLARSQVAKDGGDLVETVMGLEVDIWSQRNPYRYMYELIKDVHPSYKDVKGKDAGEETQDTSKGKKSKKAPAKKAPLSAMDLARGGGEKNMGEWTAEKIDNLPESELNKVPKDVYEAFLKGELDK